MLKLRKVTILMMRPMMTQNAFTVGKFGLNQNMKMAGYSALAASDGPMKHARVVMTPMMSFIANSVRENIFFLLNVNE
ncbi:unnamed protein product [Acanthoscelides obtectus]|uniref:Uncharacterized protein n=1 Tax=Acanthoscelides obtectus TaxID=200917 RepID=A0A9P0K0I6_ACAOB|nr:unnamed protein product [Acanthoscelides obtectus]CAK1633777.1 hypothetical protein AOBTE_LOCUS8384 [Acanthoscelides obtectus]